MSLLGGNGGSPSVNFPEWPRVALGLRISLSHHCHGQLMPATLSPVATACSVRCLVQVRTSPGAVRVHPFHVSCAAGHILGSGISRVTSTRFRGSSWDGLQVLPTFQFFWNWDGLTLFTSAPTALSLWPDARRCPAGDRCPLPVRVFNSMFSVP